MLKIRNNESLPVRATLKFFLTLLAWFTLAMFAASSIRTVQAETTTDTARLSPQETVFASRTLDFIEKMNGIYFDAALQLNGNDNRFEQRALDTDFGTWDTRVARGPVMEKSGPHGDDHQETDVSGGYAMEPLLGFGRASEVTAGGHHAGVFCCGIP